MSFPIQFMNARGSYDILAYVVNVPLNGAVVGVGGAGLLSVSSFALKALGFEETAATVAKAVPLVINTSGVVGVVALASFAILLARGVRAAIGGA